MLLSLLFVFRAFAATARPVQASNVKQIRLLQPVRSAQLLGASAVRDDSIALVRIDLGSVCELTCRVLCARQTTRFTSIAFHVG